MRIIKNFNTFLITILRFLVYHILKIYKSFLQSNKIIMNLYLLKKFLTNYLVSLYIQFQIYI